MTSQVVIVTGAGSGIGRAVSSAFIQAGFNVVLTGRRLAPLQATVSFAQQTNENHGLIGVLDNQVLVQTCDVTDEEQVDTLFQQAVAKFSRVDILFNNAGWGSFARLLDEMSVQEWREVMDVNINGMFICARAAFRQMRQQNPQGGRIINNGSISATTPRPMSSAYTTSKHAVTGLTKSIALDGRAFNIACGQIDIGNAATDMTERMGSGILQAHGELMVEPLMDVKHVAQAVVQMASFPLETNVLFTTIMATKMPFVGRG